MGLFNKHKENDETLQTNDIKQATISDTQKNSIPAPPVENFNNSFAPNQQANNNQQMQNNNNRNQNFNNPFASSEQPNNNQMQQNDFEQSKTNNNFQNSQDQINNQNQFSNQQNIQDLNMQNMQNSLNHNTNNNLSREEITEMIDETVEKLIEEKWDSLVDNVNKIIKWKDITENQINLLKDDILSLSEGFAKLESKLINKISNYDKNILDVNSEIKALEKVFQKITPTLINNVNELSRIADNFKSIEPKQKRDENVRVKQTSNQQVPED